MGTRVEYVGVKVTEEAREYVLRATTELGEQAEHTLVIPHEAFRTELIRYQDAPDICYQKLLRQLIATGAALIERRHQVTDADLEEYRQAHAPKATSARPAWGAR